MDPRRVFLCALVSPVRATWLMLVWVWVLMLGLVNAPTADACTCVRSPDNCTEIGTADAVFEATVEATELAPRSAATSPEALAAGAASQSLFSNDLRVITFRDVKAWRGQPQTTVVTASDGASCGYEFRAGTRYLVVAQRLPDGRLSVSRCGLTRPLSQATQLVEYIQTLNGPAAQTRVWGQVKKPVRWIDLIGDFDPVPAARVTVNGPERRSVTTGADGRYALADLLHGLYTVSVDMPGTLPQLGRVEPESIALDKTKAHACAELDFVAPITSAISGVITDETGRPLGGVFVNLGLADQFDRSRGIVGAEIETDVNGRYQFLNLPPGQYLAGVNIGGGWPTQRTPFPETYARTVAGEAVISLGSGERITLAATRVRRLTQVTVSGTVSEPDGSRARGVDITAAMFLEYGRIVPMFSVKTDADGGFQLRLWQGERYRITIGPRFNLDADLEFVAGDKPLSITLRGR